MPRRTSLPVLLASVLVASSALAAPDEEALGKAEGYPICPDQPLRPETRCLVGLVSRWDEIHATRKVPRGESVRPLKRAPAEPAIRYRFANLERPTLDDYLARNRTTGLLVLKDDTILVERYQYDRRPEQRMASYSMAKTVVGMLVGIAISEGRIRSIDDRADAYVPALAGTPYGETPIRHLLTMSSGIRYSETYGGSDDVAVLARLSMGRESEGGAATVAPFRTREHAPGERFNYSSADTQVLGLVLRAATGVPLADYLSEKIWRPMGAKADASWTIDKGGYETAYCCLNATLRDYARLGMLLANDGALDGRQIVPAQWVRAATTPPSPRFEPGQTGALYGYGYQTWIVSSGRERQFALWGLRGQNVFVDPARKLVTVNTSAGGLGDAGSGERLSLWYGVVDSVGR
ncbi:MAG: serine hydrolase [Betaproteobacteria bacterium]|nr:serine hydrolase [Betaproteobacteria bacterium]